MGEKTSIILTALGGPESLDEVGPFMTAFMKRPPPPPVLAAVQERYALIGGKSPLVEIVKGQASALEKELGREFSVYPGFRHSNPSIAESFKTACEDGTKNIVAISLSPYETEVTTGTYKKAFEEMALPAGCRLRFVSSFHDNPLFIDAWCEAIAPALRGAETGSTAVVFTGHSIPLRYIESGDPYKSQVEETVRLITDRINIMNWFIGWQSKGARASEPWIEPEVESILMTIAESGVKSIVEVPVGFTCDHLETLYDIDIVHKSFAEKLGLSFYRVPSLNTNQLFIRALADIARGASA
jgi:protoporphyrin/coproporphyrin ferrochelatase